MTTLQSKDQVKQELQKAGIEICTTRTVSYNSFNLIHESYGFFVVNAKAGTSFDKVRWFTSCFSNINICIDN